MARLLRPLTADDARRSFAALQAIKCTGIGDVSKFARIGLDCLDYFFLHHRLRARTKRHISFVEALESPDVVAYINDKVRQIKKKDPEALDVAELLRVQYSVFQLYYGTINQFRPTEVLRLLCRFRPTVGVLDFSAGWGGRCLGCIAYGDAPYIGIDANVGLRTAYKQMIRLTGAEDRVRMFFQPAETVDFSALRYDLVFTSPPYFMLEEYEKMPAYGSKEGFLAKFFRPVVAAAWRYLQPGGHMALNMPKEMYDAVKDILPPLWRRLQLPIQNRHPRNAAVRGEIGALNAGQRSEGIYVWAKPAVGGSRYTRRRGRS